MNPQNAVLEREVATVTPPAPPPDAPTDPPAPLPTEPRPETEPTSTWMSTEQVPSDPAPVPSDPSGPAPSEPSGPVPGAPEPDPEQPGLPTDPGNPSTG